LAVSPTYASQLLEGKVTHVLGDIKEAVLLGTVGAADTYVTGGFTVTPAQLGLQQIAYIEPVTFSGGHWGVFTPSTGLLKVFSAAGTELANASTALQSATFQVVASGK
jgi:hypothetical protein